MTVPYLDAQARRDAAGQARDARRVRALVKRQLAQGELDFAELLVRARHDPVVAQLRVVEALGALPRFGPARSQRVMDDIGIAPNRRLRGLGARQRAALLALLVSGR